MNRRLLLSVSLLGLAALFALLALDSPVKTLPALNIADQQQGIANSGVALQRAIRIYFLTLDSYSSYQRQQMTAGCFVGLAVIVALWGLIPRTPTSSRKYLRLPLFVLSFVLGLYCFSFILAATDHNWLVLPLSHYLNNPDHNIPQTYGYATVMVFVCAVVGFTLSLHELRGGWLRPFWDTVRFYGVPMVLTLELGLLARWPSWMPFYVVTSFRWTYQGAYILSNWNVLVVALILAALGYLVQPAVSYAMWRKKHA